MTFETTPAGQSTLEIGLHVRDWPVLVIGTGPVALERVTRLSESGAKVTLVAPEAWCEALCENQRVVLLTVRDPTLVAAAKSAARAHGALFYAQDLPSQSDFSMRAIVRRGPVSIAISTGGLAPALAARLRAEFERLLGDDFVEFAMGVVRTRRLDGPSAARARSRNLRIEGRVILATADGDEE